MLTAAIADQLSRGSTMMLPTEDSLWVGEELARRFGLPYWQVTTSATDANRFIVRLCRMFTGRSKIVTFNCNYHGSVDETQVELDDAGRMVPRTGVHPNAMDHEQTTRLVEFNDIPALEEALAHGDVACVLTEPILTNIGMVPAEPGYHEALRRLTREHDVPLIIDETHTISTGPRGYTGEHGLEPDFFVLGKSIAGGIPVAVWGASEAMARRIWSVLPHFRAGQEINHFGFGGTLAGSALQMRAIRATLEEVMTDGQLPAHDRAGGAHGSGHPRHHRGEAAALARDPHRGEGGVSLPAPGSPERRRSAPGPARPAGGMHPPVHAQSRGASDSVPQHGSHVPVHPRRGRRSARPAAI